MVKIFQLISGNKYIRFSSNRESKSNEKILDEYSSIQIYREKLDKRSLNTPPLQS